MVTFRLLNFGCRASQADGAALKRQLFEAGFQEAVGTDQSHLAVLNTCTVTATADAEARQLIRRIHRTNPRCRILVTGCYAQRAPQEIAQLPGVTWVVGNSHKHAVADLIRRQFSTLEALIGADEVPADGISDSSDAYPGLVQIRNPAATSLRVPSGESPPESRLRADPSSARVLVGEISSDFHWAPVFPDDRTRPTLKIQDGCNARCSFCVIPHIRGRSRSLAPEKVIEQVRELERAGYREIVLSGINLGSYGRDFDPRITFLRLLERILAETSVARVRISSIEPMDVSSELIRLVAREPRLAQHFHLPLQSGCDRILRLMNRRYWAAQYAERLLAIHEQIPNCGIGADVMVGFPGETLEDHSTSARFIESLPFTYLHVFPYSPRPMTPAASRADHVNGRLVRERSREIRSLMAKKRQAFLATQVGGSLSAVTLDEADQGARVALSTNYLKVALPGAPVAPNVLLTVRACRVQGGLLWGYPEP